MPLFVPVYVNIPTFFSGLWEVLLRKIVFIGYSPYEKKLSFYPLPLLHVSCLDISASPGFCLVFFPVWRGWCHGFFFRGEIERSFDIVGEGGFCCDICTVSM